MSDMFLGFNIMLLLLVVVVVLTCELIEFIVGIIGKILCRFDVHDWYMMANNNFKSNLLGNNMMGRLPQCSRCGKVAESQLVKRCKVYFVDRLDW